MQKFAEVFTPQSVVEKMCDMLPDDAFEPQKTFLEPACGEGVFILEILRRKFARCKKRTDYTAAINSVYGMEIQADNVQICIENVTRLCRQYFTPTKSELETIKDHIILCDSLKVMKLLNHYGK